MLKKWLISFTISLAFFGVVYLLDKHANNQDNPYFFYSIVVVLCTMVTLLLAAVVFVTNLFFKKHNINLHIMLGALQIVMLTPVGLTGGFLTWKEYFTNKYVDYNFLSLAILMASAGIIWLRDNKNKTSGG